MRSWYYDSAIFTFRPYQDTIEVLSYLNLPKWRGGNYLIFVNDDGVLNPNGTFTGGAIEAWWFKNGVADSNLVLFAGSGGGGGSGAGIFSLDTTVTADGSFIYDFDFPAEPWVYNDLPNLDSVTWTSGVIYFHLASAPVSPEQLHFQVIGGSGGGGSFDSGCVGCITQLQLNDSMANVRATIAAREAIIRTVIADTAAEIRADFPAPGGGGSGTTDFALTFNTSGGASPGASFNGSSAFTVSPATIGAVPESRTLNFTAPMNGIFDLSGNRTITMTQASTSVNGWLSATDWNTFNSKVSAGVITSSGLTMGSGVLLGRYSASTGAIQQITLGANLSLSGAGVLSATGGGGGGGTTDFPLTFATTGGAAPGTDFNGAATVIISPTSIGAVSTAFTLTTTSPLLGGGNFTANRTLSIQQATTGTNGYLSATDWNTFNNKLSNITGKITAGTDISITGSGTTASPYVITSTADGGGGGGADLGLEYYSTYTTLANTAPIDVDYDDGGNFTITLNANRTLNFLNAKIGVPIYITVTQDGTGNRFLTFPNNTKFVFGISDPGSHILNLSSGGAQVDIICVVKDPVNFNVWMAKDMRF